MTTTPTPLLPDATHVARTLSGLVGRAVACSPSRPPVARPPAKATKAKEPAVYASFVAADGALAAAWICDLPLAASVAAALVMLPPVIVGECLAAGKVEENVLENLHEVLNVCAALFNAPGAPRVVLGAVAQGATMPAAIAAFAKSAATRLDLDVAVPGYVGGRLTLLGR